MTTQASGSKTDTEGILHCVLDRWKDAVDRHEPDEVAELFTKDAIFQGSHPYTVGPRGVADYYASQPEGLSAAYRVMESRRLSPDLVLGYMAVDFTLPDETLVGVNLAVLLKRSDSRWLIDHYQVSLPAF
jgi:uncharacterized protein (TIGR02246 family)